MRFLIFGTGRFYLSREIVFYKNLALDDSIVGFVDNRAEEIKKFHDLPVYSPYDISFLPFDIIVLMSISCEEMRKQLIDIGVSHNKIWSWDEYLNKQKQGRITFYSKTNPKLGKRILILTTDMNYDGGTIAAVSAAYALQRVGYNVCILAPFCNYTFLQEIIADGVNVAICPTILYMGPEECMLINFFDVVIVNVFQMLPCACEISNFRPVLWWIHEPKELYSSTIERFSQYADRSNLNRLRVVAVSDIAKKIFNENFFDIVNAVMPFGIRDEFCCGIKTRIENNGLKFAIIGTIIYCKGQDIFLSAVQDLLERTAMPVDFFLIGVVPDDDYAENIKSIASKMKRVHILGNLTRQEMHDVYQKIDVVVCASREETMSIVVVEGLMYGKICITTDATGISKYIQNGRNGFVCRAKDANDLFEKMLWILHHPKECDAIRINARKTYEKFFTMDKFAERLIENIEKAEYNWENKKWRGDHEECD